MLHQLLKRTLEIDPDRAILEANGTGTNAAELERLASRLASGLAALGLEEGVRVALLLPNGDSPAVMIYTSGTTSRPKGVVLAHGALSTGVRKYLARVTLTPEDVPLIVTSVSRPLALRCQVLPTLWAGGRISLLRGFGVGDYYREHVGVDVFGG